MRTIYIKKGFVMNLDAQYEIGVMQEVRTHLEGYKAEQERTFMGRKICAQTTSCLYSLICCAPATIFGCLWVFAQCFGCGDDEIFPDRCVGTPQPARSQRELSDKYCDLECCCLCCQEPASYYSLPEERRTLQEVSTKIEGLRSGVTALQTSVEYAEQAPEPMHQMMLDYLE